MYFKYISSFSLLIFLFTNINFKNSIFASEKSELEEIDYISEMDQEEALNIEDFDRKLFSGSSSQEEQEKYDLFFSICLAVENGDIKLVEKLLINNNIDVNDPYFIDVGAGRLLHMAILSMQADINKKTDIIKFLIQNKADIHAKTQCAQKESSLHLAARSLDSTIYDLLIKYGADKKYAIDPEKKLTASYYAKIFNSQQIHEFISSNTDPENSGMVFKHITG